MKRIIIFACFLVAACHGGSTEETEQPVVSVHVAKARIGTIAQPVELVGTITPRQEAGVSSKIGAQIARMDLLKNRPVHAGDVLVQLESRDLTAQRNEASAALVTANDAIVPARAAVENARRTYERRKDLYAKGGISKKDLESSQLEVTNAEGTLKTSNSKVGEATNHLASLDAQLGYSVIRAPFDGIVTEQFVREGDFAAAGSKLLTVADTSTVIVKAQAASETAARIRPGDLATIQTDDFAGVSYQGRVSLVGRAADPQSRAVEVWVALPNRDGRLRPNGSVRVTIASNAAGNAVIVPTPAVTLDATNAGSGTVMVVDA
ncbi:MAG TPA: efflux RND transporter periplasmic adaptor subunit, partial [Thermoanaerobaculia bacterium]